MAKILTSDLAPNESAHYSFAMAEFDLGGSGKGSKRFYETDDRALLSEAEVHPWLRVEYDPAEEYVSVDRFNSVRPEDDVLSATGPNKGIAFDPKEIAKVENAKAAAAGAPAIEAGLDQGEVIEVADVPVTVAADNASDDEKDNS